MNLNTSGFNLVVFSYVWKYILDTNFFLIWFVDN